MFTLTLTASSDNKGEIVRTKNTLMEAMQFRQSGYLIICTIKAVFTCSLTKFDSFGERASIYKHYNLKVRASSSINDDGSVWLLSGGFDVIITHPLRSPTVSSSDRIMAFHENKGLVNVSTDYLRLPVASVGHCLLSIRSNPDV